MTAEQASLVDSVAPMAPAADPPAEVPGGKLPLLNEMVTAPSFRVVLRGYDARQVDRYAHLVEAELRARTVAHQELAADLHSIALQLDRANEEIAVLRRRPTVDDEVAFKHLGPRVEQILVDAHAEAEEVVAAATRSADELRARNQEQLDAIRAEYEQAVATYEEHRRWLREEEERWARLLSSRQEQVTRAEHYRRKVQEDAEAILASATQQGERVVDSAMARAEEVLAQANTEAARIRAAAESARGADHDEPVLEGGQERRDG